MMHDVKFGETRFSFNDDMTGDVYIGVFGDEKVPVKVTAMLGNGKKRSSATVAIAVGDMADFACYYAGLVLGRNLQRTKS